MAIHETAVSIEVQPLSDEQFKSFWRHAEEYGMAILKAVLLSDLYHRAEAMRLKQGGTVEECISAEAQHLGIELNQVTPGSGPQPRR